MEKWDTYENIITVSPPFLVTENRLCPDNARTGPIQWLRCFVSCK